MSKKLNGNGRWESSRMMLPEHREQYLERKHSMEKEQEITLPTQEEMELIREFIILPMLLSIVDKNCREIELSTYSLKSLYVKASQLLMTKVHSDLSEVRKKMRLKNIKVFENERIDSAIHYGFVCRGYKDNFAMMRDVARAEISMRISRYVSDLFK